MKMLEEIREAVTYVGSRTKLRPRVAVVLGSGLGAFASDLSDATSLSYADIPHFPSSTVEGHQGSLFVGNFKGVPLYVMSGRVHAYEGHAPDAVVLPVRVLGLLGVKSLVLTNAAGAINTAFRPGELMLVTDHINATGLNPLVGPERTELGPRFVDMSEAYHPALIAACQQAARRIGLNIRKGVYIGLLGPSFETPAEIRMMRTLGADAVGMSTVLETIAAIQMGMKVLAISSLTNMAAGVQPHKLDHREVLEMGKRIRSVLLELLAELIPAIQKAG
ncbi:MAG TPA: purine-nucleoside phosphorylase [Vicinamibacteria bacterium]|nr:purine-nucleoside phosphorylase [Vicinamibacteria bacterium]